MAPKRRLVPDAAALSHQGSGRDMLAKAVAPIPVLREGFSDRCLAGNASAFSKAFR